MGSGYPARHGARPHALPRSPLPVRARWFLSRKEAAVPENPAVSGLPFTRRTLVGLGAAAVAAPALVRPGGAAAASPARRLEEASIADLQAAMAEGALNARVLVRGYQARIRDLDRKLGSVLEVNPDAYAIARDLDAERRAGHVRGPLHGIPILLKANIDTADRMQTT